VTNLRRVFHNATHGGGKMTDTVTESTQFSLLRICTDSGHCISKSLPPSQQKNPIYQYKSHLLAEIRQRYFLLSLKIWPTKIYCYYHCSRLLSIRWVLLSHHNLGWIPQQIYLLTWKMPSGIFRFWMPLVHLSRPWI